MHKRRKSVVLNAAGLQNSKNLVIHNAVRSWFYFITHYIFKEKDY